MNKKQPSIFVELEKYDNIAVRELGIKNLGENTVNVMETIEIVDIKKLQVIFQIQVPLSKSWLITVKDKDGFTYFCENIEDVYNDHLRFYLAIHCKPLFSQKQILCELAADNQESELDNYNKLQKLEEIDMQHFNLII